ncbi:MAG: DMT family transporter [Verrucomicrobiota bacterium]|nr:DMT family transporter [Verrucomicrobiota bacterium]
MPIIFCLYFVWSASFPLGKMALAYSPPLFLTAVRMLVAGLILLLFLFIRKPQELKITREQFLPILLFAFFAIYATNAFEFWSLKTLSAAKTCAIYSLSPFLSAFFSWLHFGEKMNGRKWLGFAIGLCGIVPILLLQKGAGELLTTIPFLSWPELTMLGAVISTVYGWIVMRWVVKEKSSSHSFLTTNAFGMTLGGIVSLGHSLCVESWDSFPLEATSLKPFLFIVLLMIILSNLIGYNLHSFLLKRFTATLLSFLGLLTPVFASLISWLLLGEPLSSAIFLSTAIVCIGAWFVHSAELKQGYLVRSNDA